MEKIAAVATILSAMAAWLALYPLAKKLVRRMLRTASAPSDAETTYLQSLVRALEEANEKNRWTDKLYLPVESELRDRGPRVDSKLSYYVVRSIHRNINQQEFNGLTNAEKIDSSMGTTYSSLEMALRNGRTKAAVVIGDPGSGKTVSLRNLALSAARRRLSLQRAPVPIFVSLTYYTSSGSDGRPEAFEDFIERYFRQGGYQSYLADGRWRRILQSSQAIVFLDGLDELPRAPHEHDPRVRFIEAFVQSWPMTQFVVSCRERDYDFRLSFEQILIKPFDDGRVRRYVASYFGRRRANEVFLALSTTPYMAEICSNPFYLDLICYFTKRRGSFPKSKTELFDYIVHEVFRRESAKRKIELTDDGFKAWRSVLGELARTMSLEQYSSSMSLTHYLKDIDADAEVESIVRGAIDGGLLEYNAASDAVRFQHHRFQEFFCADSLVTQIADPLVEFAPVFFSNLWWRETVLFLAGLADEANAHALVQRILSCRPGVSHANASFASTLKLDLTILAFEAVLISPEYSDRQTYEQLRDELIETYRSGNVFERARVVEALRSDESDESLELMQSALEDDSAWVSERAFFALSHEGLRVSMKPWAVCKELVRFFIEGRIVATVRPILAVSRYSRAVRLMVPFLFLLSVVNLACIGLVAYGYFHFGRFVLFRLNYEWGAYCLRCLGATLGSMVVISHFLFSESSQPYRNFVRVAPLVALMLYISEQEGMSLGLLAFRGIGGILALWFYLLVFNRQRDRLPVGLITALYAGSAVGDTVARRWGGASIGEKPQVFGVGFEPLLFPLSLIAAAGGVAGLLWYVAGYAMAVAKLKECDTKFASALSMATASDEQLVGELATLFGLLGLEWAQRVFLSRALRQLRQAPGFSAERVVILLGSLAKDVSDRGLRDTLFIGLEQEWSRYRRGVEPRAGERVWSPRLEFGHPDASPASTPKTSV